MAVMVQLKIHFVDKHALDRLNTAVMLSFVGSGLFGCVIGAAVYDVGRWLSFW